MPVLIKKADNSDGPQIGLSASSETKIPTRRESPRLPGLGIWDAPGFDDNRRPTQDIINAFYITELFKTVKSARIVLVTDINDIAHGQIKPLMTLFNSVENLLEEKLKYCFHSLAVIFTKVPEVLNECKVDKNFANNLLKYFLLSKDINISKQVRNLMDHLIENSENIGFFRKAGEGKVNRNSIDIDIIEAIQSRSGIDEQILEQVSPSIADGSKVFLFKAREKLSSMEKFNQLQKLVANVFEVTMADSEKLRKKLLSREELFRFSDKFLSMKNKIQKVLDSDTSLYSKIAAFQVFNPEIKKLIDDNKLLQKAKLMEFIDKLLNLKESAHFERNIHSILLSAKAKCEELIIRIKFELHDLSAVEAQTEKMKIVKIHEETVAQLQNEIMHIKEHNNKVKKESGIFTRVGKFRGGNNT